MIKTNLIAKFKDKSVLDNDSIQYAVGCRAVLDLTIHDRSKVSILFVCSEETKLEDDM